MIPPVVLLRMRRGYRTVKPRLAAAFMLGPYLGYIVLFHRDRADLSGSLLACQSPSDIGSGGPILVAHNKPDGVTA